jgi:ActR/RegA family two-component response regulator
VDTAITAEDALQKTATCDYALAVVDMDMEDEAGQRFVRGLREQRPEATTFILAVRDPNNDAFLDPALVSAVLNKPLEIDTLAEAVRETALVVVPPEEPLRCPPSDSEIRTRLERGSFLAN